MMGVSVDEANSSVLGPLFKEAVKQRWFPERKISHSDTEISDVIPLDSENGFFNFILRIKRGDSAGDLYQIPLKAEQMEKGSTGRFTFDASLEGRNVVFSDALENPEFHKLLLSSIGNNGDFKSEKGSLMFKKNRSFSGKVAQEIDGKTRIIGTEQSNTSVVYNDRLIYKNFRKMAAYPSPDYEVPYFICHESRDKIVPKPLGYATYTHGGNQYAAGILSVFAKNSGEAWKSFLRLFTELDQSVVDESAKLGKLTANIHNVLSSSEESPEFAPEPITELDVRKWKDEFVALFNQTLRMLSDSAEDTIRVSAGRIYDMKDRFLECADLLDSLASSGVSKIRIHGDYHLGQILRTGPGYMAIDFEGEPARSPEYRRSKNCAIKDLGGLVRSIDYASAFGSAERGEVANIPTLKDEAEKALIDSYWGTAGKESKYLPSSRREFEEVLNFFVVEKAIYEMKYEALYRPGWLWVPVSGALDICKKL